MKIKERVIPRPDPGTFIIQEKEVRLTNNVENKLCNLKENQENSVSQKPTGEKKVFQEGHLLCKM